MSGFTAKDVPDQAGRVFIVTGANTGIGFEAARVLAAKGGRVIVACRDESKARQAIDRILQRSPAADLAFVRLDLADLDSVRAAAQTMAKEPRIDCLINNAGVMFPPLQRTAEGFELQWGVNHLAPFALTALLLPKLAEGQAPRIVVTSSLAHKGGNIDWEDLDARESYSRTKRYSDSKLANMLHVFELDRRLRATGSPISVIACHPGFARTDLSRHSGPFRVLFPLAGWIFNSAAQGAWPTLQAATDPKAESGSFYGPQRMGGASGPSGPAKRTDQACDPVLARRLWDVSIEMTGIDPALPPA